MQIKETEIKELIIPASDFEKDFLGVSHSLNLFKGCSGQCAFCGLLPDKKSEQEIEVFINAPSVLAKEIVEKYKGGVIGIGTDAEIFQLSEKYDYLLNEIFTILIRYKVPVHIFTKTNTLLKGHWLSMLKELSKNYLTISISLFTVNEETAGIFEPGAPKPEKRLAALSILSKMKILTGVLYSPILPDISDDFDEMENVIKMSKAYNSSYIIFAPELKISADFSKKFYSVLKKNYPALVKKYMKLFSKDNHEYEDKLSLLKTQIDFLCNRYDIEIGAPFYRNIYKDGQFEMFKNEQRGK